MHIDKPPAHAAPPGIKDPAHPFPAPAPRDGALATLDSRTLLQGQGSVAIRHHGVVYRLQATKLGKLILTK